MKFSIALNFFVLIILSSCSVSKKKSAPSTNNNNIEQINATTTENNTKLKINNLDSIINNQKIDFELFNAEADMEYADNETEITGTMHIRMIKDSLVWISLQKFGFEGVRAFFTKDSIFILNRIEKTYIANSIQDLSKVVGISLSIKELQNIIIGNIVLPFQSIPCFNTNKTGYSIEQISEKKDKYSLNWNFSDPFLSSINYQKSTNDIFFNIQQQEYQENIELINYKFSNIRKIKLVSPTKTFNIDLKFTEINWNDSKKLPFDIPNHYRKVIQF